MADSRDVSEWFSFAFDDLAAAKNLMITMWPRPLHIVSFHCQQAAEKYIKGVMTHFEIETIKIHDLTKLLEMLYGEADVASISDACAFLTQYAVVARYPFGPELDEDETRMAIAQAQKVKEWAEGIVQLDGGNDSE